MITVDYIDTIVIEAPAASQPRAIDLALAEYGWVSIDTRPDRLVIAPMRDQLQFPKHTPTAIGLYAGRIEEHYAADCRNVRQLHTVTPIASLAQWMASQEKL